MILSLADFLDLADFKLLVNLPNQLNLRETYYLKILSTTFSSQRLVIRKDLQPFQPK